jgi:hypothetical protein
MRRSVRSVVFAGQFFFIPLVQISLKCLGYQRTKVLVTRLSPCPGPMRNEVRNRTLSISAAVESSMTSGLLKGTCLHRSMYLWWLLRWAKCPAYMVTGVRKDKDTGKIFLHAWLEQDGVPLNERARVVNDYKRFTFPNE